MGSFVAGVCINSIAVAPHNEPTSTQRPHAPQNIHLKFDPIISPKNFALSSTALEKSHLSHYILKDLRKSLRFAFSANHGMAKFPSLPRSPLGASFPEAPLRGRVFSTYSASS